MDMLMLKINLGGITIKNQSKFRYNVGRVIIYCMFVLWKHQVSTQKNLKYGVKNIGNTSQNMLVLFPTKTSITYIL